MGPDKPEAAGAACVCDLAGMVREVLHDDLGLLPPERTGRPFAGVLDPGSLGKWFSLLETVRGGEPAYDWELEAPLGERVRPVRLAAMRMDDRVLIAAVGVGGDVLELLEDLGRMSHEHVSLLRRVLQQKQRPSAAAQVDWESFTELHNELISLQRKLAKQNAQLQRLNEEKNRLLGMVAHDLRNPLHTVEMACEALSLSGPLDERQQRLVAAIRESSRVMSTLVASVLDSAAIEAGRVELRLERLDVARAVARAVELQRVLAERKQIAIELDLPAEGLDAEVDPGKLDQILSNLLSNAIKYSPTGTVTTVSLEAAGDQLELRVADQGLGIPEADRPGLFRPFGTTTTRATGGETSTGLGLAIVQRIVQEHRGTIDLESEVGVGTTFRVRLPRRIA